MNTPNTIILGAGGHAKVLVDILRQREHFCGAFVSPMFTSEPVFSGLQWLASDDDVCKFSSGNTVLVNGIGMLPGKHLRKELFLSFSALGYRFKKVISPQAIVSTYAELGDGVQVLPGAIIQAGVVIGANTIINSGAIIEHDCVIGEHCHIAPGVTMSGQVSVGTSVHIGTGANLIQSISVGEDVVVGAGAIVTKNVDSFKKVYPARGIIKR
ncbi:acetyltransferase [Halodesulfovibrio marinisediminis]|uniref:Sugar O-acyltransferase, sialic acid O-acetyltransferase NeuD family n=1 Tax=Halodesulfovibrio marinisediminis DSM 17456 TaxID=1121457 RepID=A0A1N6FTJ9_9BACT|nr:acetyltransferase [Halodesulfovibrio marinisediminis]SIN98578.1 sugar O-acyltransferase, sialic acid O-acetyltransferase NeuD family [Halodesulfovibrio marinisediminis DSM 17456]